LARYVADQSMATLFVSGSLDSLLPSNSLARLLLASLENLDFTAFECKYRNDDRGRPALEPRRLASVWLLALIRGVTSSVALSALCKRDIEFRWLLGGVEVRKSTLCDFRRDHLEALGELSTQILAALARSGQLAARELVLDGTIVRAASSCSAVRERGTLRKRVARLRDVIDEALESAEVPDSEGDQLKLSMERLNGCLAEMDEMGLMDDGDRITSTEPEASLKKLKRGGFGPAHNVQAVSDAEGGAIINVEVIAQGNDQGQLAPQVEAAQAVLEQVSMVAEAPLGPVQGVAADGAYHNPRQLKNLAEQGIEAAVPDGQGARRPEGVSDAYLSDKFNYDESTDTFICPEGHALTSWGLNENKTSQKYRARAKDCATCPAKTQCCPTSKKVGRSVNRRLEEETIQTVAEHCKSEKGVWRRRARSVTSEGVFARMIEALHWRRCRTWGRKGAMAEARWRQIAHNLLLLTGHWRPITMKEMIPG